MIWGDARVGNVIFADDLSVAAVLDWEMATLGPIELDVAWWLMFEELQTGARGILRLEGIPGPDEPISLYEELSGRRLRDLNYYMTLDWLRLSLTRTRMVLAAATQDPTEYLATDPVICGLSAQLRAGVR